MDNSYSQRAQSEVVPVMSKTTPTGAIMFGGGGREIWDHISPESKD